MMRLVEVDLLSADLSVEPSADPVWITVRAGDEILGHVERPWILWTELPSLRLDLLARFAEQLYARSRIRPANDRATMTASDVTVVVCTRDRPDFLEAWLEAASQLDPRPGEIVVVDNASVTDATKALAEQHGVRYVLEPMPGLDRARNRGWQETATEIVAFVDDDARLEANYASAIAGGFFAPVVAGVTGLVLPAELGTHPQLVLEREVWGYSMAGVQRRLFHADVAAVGFETWRVGVGANMAFRREVLDAVGGFDPRLDLGTRTRGGGDLDMLFRVLDARHAVLFEPKAIVRHVHRRDEDGLVTQLMDWGVALSAYLAKRQDESAQRRRDVKRYRRRLRYDVFVRKPLRAARTRRRLHLKMELARALGTLRGGSALRRETAIEAERRAGYGSPDAEHD